MKLLQFQTIQITNSIKLVTTFTTPTKVVGNGISGVCRANCYL